MNDILIAQQNDTFTSNAEEYLQTGKAHFDVSKLGPLKRHRKQLHLNQHSVLCWKNRVVLPKCFHSAVLELCHDHPTSGHFEEARTWDRLSANYFWPDANSDAVNWIKSCNVCNQFNPPPKGYAKQPLQPIVTHNRFELVCYDLADPLFPVRPRGNTHALIIIDHISKWPEFIPLSDTSAPTIARAIFDHWCCRTALWIVSTVMARQTFTDK